MRTQAALAAYLFVALFPIEVRGEIAPLPKEKLEAEASLVVTGIVTQVQVGDGIPRTYSVVYPIDLTIRVIGIEKGKSPGSGYLIARGTDVHWDDFYVGGGGTYSYEGNIQVRINKVRPGWGVKLHLKPLEGDLYEIVNPNGLAVLASPPDQFTGFWHHRSWLWPFAGGIAVGAIAVLFLVRRRQRQRAKLDTLPATSV